MQWRWILLRAGSGTAAALILYFSPLYDPLFYAEASLSFLIFGFASLISLLLGGLYLRYQRDQHLVNYAQ